MSLNSDFLLKVKDRVTSKLKSLGAFIDEELPDYIMVMVANNKSETSMTKDLYLFLGEHTEGFTKWLHTTLQHMKQSDAVSKSKEKESGMIEKTKLEKHKRSKSREVTSRSGRSVSHKRSRSRSPLRNNKVEIAAMSSREPHADTDALNLHADEDEFINDDISSTAVVHEERKVVSTASLKKTHSSLENESSVESKSNTNIRSIVNVRNASPPKQRPKVCRTAAKGINPTDLLLRKAFKDVQANAEPPEISSSGLTEAKPNHRPVACSDVSSSSHDLSNRTKFYITLPGNKTVPTSVTVSTQSSLDSNRLSERDRVETISSSVKSRLGSRRLLPYSRPETGRLSAKDRLGPVTNIKSNTVSRLAMDAEPVYEELEEQVDTVELVDGELGPDEPCQTEDGGGYVDPDEVERVDQRFVHAHHTRNDTTILMKSRLIDRINQKELVVNLNETDEDELSPVKGTGKNNVVAKTEKEETEQVHIPSSLDRCRYWPNCRKGKECPYIHPSEPCPTFPRCRFGATCIYIHPPCRFDLTCARPDCAFTHSAKRVLPKAVAPVLPSVATNQIVCRYQSRCANPTCPFYHSPVAPAVPIAAPITRPIAVPTTVPLSTSPVACRYGSACTNRPKCPFLHRDIPRPEQLKWVAPSKRNETSTELDTVASPVTDVRSTSLQSEAVK